MRYFKALNLLLREYSVEDYNEEIIQTRHLDIPETVAQTIEHLSKLKNLGMTVVSYALEPTSLAHEIIAPEDPVVYGASPYIPNLINLAKKNSIPKSTKYQKIIKPLESYLEWCQESQQAKLLGNIGSADRYSFHQASQTILLHNIRPLITSDNPAVILDQAISTLIQA